MDRIARGAGKPPMSVRILIVDDEILQLNLIGRIIQKFRPHYAVETAHQPAQALERLKSGDFNALMTDVKMPGMSGIELIEQARRLGLDPFEIIILSGFDDFQYARSAISFDVLEYLLKPIDSQSLQTVLGKLEDKLRQDYARIRLQSDFTGMAGKRCAMALFKKASGLALNAEEARSVSALVGERLFMALMEDCRDVDDRLSALRSKVFVEELDGGRHALFFPVGAGAQPEKLAPEARPGEIVTVGAPCAVEQLPQRWRELQELADTARRMGLLRLVQSPPAPVDRLAQAMRSRSAEAVMSLSAELCMALREGRMTLRRLERVALDEAEALIREGALPQVYPQRAKELMRLMRERLRQSRTGDELLKAVAALFEATEDENADDFERNVLIYIEAHYGGACSLDTIAKAFHYSTSHFSRRFSTQFGTTYTRYLADFRIDKACALLKDTDLSIQDIASRVGISDASYFIRMFNKKLNTSPAKYRQRGG